MSSVLCNFGKLNEGRKSWALAKIYLSERNLLLSTLDEILMLFLFRHSYVELNMLSFLLNRALSKPYLLNY